MRLLHFFALGLIGLVLFVACDLDDTISTENQNKPPKYKLKINEIMASNDTAVPDPDDDGTGDNSPYDDWFEIYNADTQVINIGGMFMTDDLDDPTKWQIPKNNPAKTTIAPGGFLLIWADKEMSQGALHVDFSLSGDGETIGIFAPDGQTELASYTFGAQQTDFSIGCDPDGSDNWIQYAKSTPGASNSGGSTNMPPIIQNLTIAPDSLTPATPVTISADIVDANNNLATVVLTYGPENEITNQKNMAATGSTYKAEIGPFADGSRIYYFISATDAEAAKTVSDTLMFEVGYMKPALFINEFLASNDSSTKDENGENDDWIEIYNGGATPVNIGGMYITDKLSSLTAWLIPNRAPDSTTIAPGGFLILWADKQTKQGVLHVDIKLSGDGEQIGLTAPNGTTVIDSLTFGAQTEDISLGRKPDGSNNWEYFAKPTPGASNN